MGGYVLSFHEIDASQSELVGGKGAKLGALSRIEGILVPPGFCVTTDAFKVIIERTPQMNTLLERLSQLTTADLESVRAVSTEIRSEIERVVIPVDIARAITDALSTFDAASAFAVRSSATAEDLPSASFAGQHDSYLNIVGPSAMLTHVSKCWASLFTERAVMYRLHNGIAHDRVHMAVVVQRMVFPEASGVLFTADPLTGHRKTASIDATVGLGDALVSGLVNPDVYTVRDGVINTSRLHESPLSNAQILRLVALGRRIEAHFGAPQDIEWCLSDDVFAFVQSRPITTLFPVPNVGDDAFHVYLSVGHQQMMTDPFTPLGLSVWQMGAARPMLEAGGRLFVDVSKELASPTGRAGLFAMAGKSDPLTASALTTIIERGDVPLSAVAPASSHSPLSQASASTPLESDATIVDELIEQSQRSIDTITREISEKSGTELLEYLLADAQEHKRALFDPRSLQVIMAGIDATWWLNEHMQEWLGEKNAADILAQSVPNNVTSEMGLALLDVADAIRPHAEVLEFLRTTNDDNFLEILPTIEGGVAARDALHGWLTRYGMRGVGEIDVTRPRWSEQPITLLPLILGHVANFPSGESQRRFEQGRRTAVNKEHELLDRLRSLPDGEHKATDTKRMIDRLRTFVGYREYPKYAKISREFAYRQALLREAEQLTREGVLHNTDDIFYLRIEELQTVVRTHTVDHALIRQRREAFRSYHALTPPRVMTSDGEILNGSLEHKNAPADALVGLAVSAGVVEGRARVILNAATADFAPGDILVTRFTDPSWTPLFVAIKGLVTEVGGLMTHGAVIAREYGLPAVVGVERATQRIRDGQQIRVNGTDGYVEILP